MMENRKLYRERNRRFSTFLMGNMRFLYLFGIVELRKDGGGGRMTHRCALRPAGRRKRRCFAALNSNLNRRFSTFPVGNMRFLYLFGIAELRKDGGGGRMTHRCALRPAGRRKRRCFAALNSNLNRRFSTFPVGNMRSLYLFGIAELRKDGGGGRIRTFEV